MAQDTKENGETIKLTEMANFGTLMAISMKGNGAMTKQKVKVFIHTPMEPNTKVTGVTISNTGTVLSSGLMEATTLVITKME